MRHQRTSSGKFDAALVYTARELPQDPTAKTLIARRPHTGVHDLLATQGPFLDPGWGT